MKKNILSIVSFAFFILSCSRDNDTNNMILKDIEFTTQEEINTYKGEILNQIDLLKISGYNISDLSPLNSINSVKRLQIDNNPKLISLQGLENLLTVSESLSITNNRSLGNFEAIKNLDVYNIVDSNSLSNKSSNTKKSNSFFKIENNLFNPRKESLNSIYKLPKKIYSGNLYISKIEEFDNFIKEKYTEIDGNIQISRFFRYSSLKGLESLSIIRGELRIESNHDLESLEGLENLTDVKGFLSLRNNESLKNLRGLDNLKKAGRILLNNNNNLINIEALKNLTYIDVLLSITGNERLSNIKGLTSLKSVGYHNGNPPSALYPLTPPSFAGVYINSNPSLISLEEGLGNLEIIGHLEIEDNPSLQSLNGLDNIEYVKSVISIDSNNSLVDLTGLNGIRHAGGLKIENNKVLESLKGLEGIHTEYGGISTFSGVDLIINNNESLENLTELDIAAIGSLFITNNNNLKNLIGLNSLKSATTLKIENNDSLSSLLGLESLIRIVNKFYVTNNINLVDFCPINKDFKIYNQFQSSYNVTGNAYNPWINQIVSTDKCKQQ